MNPPETVQEHTKKGTDDVERVGSLEIGGTSLVSISSRTEPDYLTDL